MCFAVPVKNIGRKLIREYVEDNGDGTSSTYTCGCQTLSDLLLSEEKFGGETWAHDSSDGRWTDGNGQLKYDNATADYWFYEVKKNLVDLGLQVDGFVSPYHDKLDGYAPLISKYYKYARKSMTKYPNLPY